MKSKYKQTHKARKTATEASWSKSYQAAKGLGRLKRQLRRLKAENPKGDKAPDISKETDTL